MILGVDVVKEIIDDGGELFLRLLVQVGDGDTSSEDGIVGVSDGHVCSRLCSLYKKLAMVDTMPCVLTMLTRLSSSMVVTP